MYRSCFASQILIKLGFSQQIFERCYKIKFHENSSSGRRVVPCGRTDGQTWRSQYSLFTILRTHLQTAIANTGRFCRFQTLLQLTAQFTQRQVNLCTAVAVPRICLAVLDRQSPSLHDSSSNTCLTQTTVTTGIQPTPREQYGEKISVIGRNGLL
jgi:hypothetical protein